MRVIIEKIDAFNKNSCDVWKKLRLVREIKEGILLRVRFVRAGGSMKRAVFAALGALLIAMMMPMGDSGAVFAADEPAPLTAPAPDGAQNDTRPYRGIHMLGYDVNAEGYVVDAQGHYLLNPQGERMRAGDPYLRQMMIDKGIMPGPGGGQGPMRGRQQ